MGISMVTLRARTVRENFDVLEDFKLRHVGLVYNQRRSQSMLFNFSSDNFEILLCGQSRDWPPRFKLQDEDHYWL